MIVAASVREQTRARYPDESGDVDVAAIELDRGALPASVVLRSFTPAHLQRSLQEVEVGSPAGESAGCIARGVNRDLDGAAPTVFRVADRGHLVGRA